MDIFGGSLMNIDKLLGSKMANWPFSYDSLDDRPRRLDAGDDRRRWLPRRHRLVRRGYGVLLGETQPGQAGAEGGLPEPGQ